MEFFPTFNTFLEISIGGIHLSIAWYAVLILTAALIAYCISVNTAQKLGYDKQVLEDYFVMMLPIAIIGARLYYCLFEWQQYIHDPISILYVWEGGLAIHGGIIAGVIYSYFYFRNKGYNLLRIGDCIMPNLMLAQVIGRFGNFMNHEAYGHIVSESYFKYYPEFIKNNMFIDGFYRQPTFLFEAIGNLIGFILIKTVFKKYAWRKKGDMIYAYVAWYGVVRFFVEGLRTDALLFFGLRIAQIVSLLFLVVGIAGYLGVYDRLFKNCYPFKKEKPALLFDFDGTLADTFPLIKESFYHTFKVHPIQEEMNDEIIHSFFGPPLKTTFRKYYSESEIEEVLHTYRTHNLANHDAYVKTMPHAIEVLSHFKKQGYSMAIVTSKLKTSAMHGIKHCKMLEYFDVIICADDVDYHKPHPQPLYKACEQLHVPIDNVIYIGDTQSDMESAKRMGAYSIAYATNGLSEVKLKASKPSRLIHDLNELKTILEEDEEWNVHLI